MIKEAIDYILNLGKAQSIKEINGNNYAYGDLRPIVIPKVETIVVNDLDSVIDYINEDPDKIIKESIVVINNYNNVNVDSLMNKDNFNKRDCYISSLAHDNNFEFGRYLSIEDFIPSFKANFENKNDYEEILKILSNVTDEIVRVSKDDGISQEVVMRQGITIKVKDKIPGIVKLNPYMTFPEISQIVREYVFRAKKTEEGVKFALFNVDNRVWEYQVKNEIHNYLKENIKKDIVII